MCRKNRKFLRHMVHESRNETGVRSKYRDMGEGLENHLLHPSIFIIADANEVDALQCLERH